MSVCGVNSLTTTSHKKIRKQLFVLGRARVQIGSWIFGFLADFCFPTIFFSLGRVFSANTARAFVTLGGSEVTAEVNSR